MKRYYNIPFLGKRLLNRIAKREGGEKESITLRKYFKSHHNVEVDLYSYGGCFDPYFNMGGGTEEYKVPGTNVVNLVST